MELRIGELIQTKRGKKGIRAAAQEVGVSPATLSRVENGHIPDLETFAKVCRWLNIDPGEFLGVKPVAESEKPLPVAHFRKQKTVSPETAKSLAKLILATQRAMQARERLNRR